MKTWMTAGLAAVALAVPAFAQSYDDEVEVAREIVEITGEVDLAMTAITDMIPLIEGNIRVAYPNLSARQYVQIMDVYTEEFEAARDEFEIAIVHAYVDQLSHEDLVGLRDFYLTETGRRYTAAMPTIMEAAGSAGELIGLRVDTRAAPRVRSIIRGEESSGK